MRSRRSSWLLRHRVTGQTRWSPEPPSESMWEVVRAGGSDPLSDYESVEWQEENAANTKSEKHTG